MKKGLALFLCLICLFCSTTSVSAKTNTDNNADNNSKAISIRASNIVSSHSYGITPNSYYGSYYFVSKVTYCTIKLNLWRKVSGTWRKVASVGPYTYTYKNSVWFDGYYTCPTGQYKFTSDITAKINGTVYTETLSSNAIIYDP